MRPLSMSLCVLSSTHPYQKYLLCTNNLLVFLTSRETNSLEFCIPLNASVVFRKRIEVGEECAEREKWRALFLQAVKIVCGTKRQKMKRLGGHYEWGQNDASLVLCFLALSFNGGRKHGVSHSVHPTFFLQ